MFILNTKSIKKKQSSAIANEPLMSYQLYGLQTLGINELKAMKQLCVLKVEWLESSQIIPGKRRALHRCIYQE